MRYPVAIEPGTETEAFGVVVPDLPGCFSAGDTMEEAMAKAEEAIAAWIETALDSGQVIPQSSGVACCTGSTHWRAPRARLARGSSPGWPWRAPRQSSDQWRIPAADRAASARRRRPRVAVRSRAVGQASDDGYGSHGRRCLSAAQRSRSQRVVPGRLLPGVSTSSSPSCSRRSERRSSRTRGLRVKTPVAMPPH